MTTPRWEVPACWDWVEASDVAQIVGGGTPSTKDDTNFAEPGSGIPWVGPADLTGYRGTYISRGRRDLSEKGLSASGATVMPEGTVLFSSRAPIGYCVIASNPVSTNQGFKSWICVEGLIPEYVRHYLRSSVDYVDSLASGTTFREVSGKRVASIAFPLASEAEQRRIVAKLDALTARLARARTELDRSVALTERLKQSAFEECFTSSSIQRKFGEQCAVSELSTVVRSTFYGPRIAETAYVSEGVPTLRTSDIGAWGRLNPNNPPQVRVTPKDMEKWSLRDGDIIVTRTGATIGKCALYESAIGPALPSAYLIRVRLDLSEILPEYALLFLLSPSGQDQLSAGRTATAQPNINAKAILSLRLPLPDLQVQRSIVTNLQAMLARADRLEAEAARARALLDRLEAAILVRAFRGELVPQDPNDEPASVLLERIRAERAAAPKVKRGRKAKDAA